MQRSQSIGTSNCVGDGPWWGATRALTRGGHSVAGALAVLLALSGCTILGGEQPSELRTSATAEYGLGHINNDEPVLLVGTTTWCVTQGPVRLTNVEWTEAKDLDITGFAVVNQQAGEDRIGTEAGKLAAAGLSATSVDLTSPCTPPRPGESAMISYVVLEVRSRDVQRVTTGKGLLAHWQDQQGQDGEMLEPLTVIFCPAGSQTCDDTSPLSPPT